MKSSSSASSTSLDQTWSSGHWGETTINGKSGCVATFLGGPCTATFHTSLPRSPAPCKNRIIGQRFSALASYPFGRNSRYSNSALFVFVNLKCLTHCVGGDGTAG